MNKLLDAVLTTSPDGHPVKLVVYDWETTSPQDLMLRIQQAITNGADHFHPEGKVRARSFAFLAVEERGNFFVTKGCRTSAASLIVPAGEFDAVVSFWTDLDAMLTCTTDEEPGETRSKLVRGDRSEASICFVGCMLDTGTDGTSLENILTATFQCPVLSAVDESVEGCDILATYFDMSRWSEARMSVVGEVKHKVLGYDQKEIKAKKSGKSGKKK